MGVRWCRERCLFGNLLFCLGYVEGPPWFVFKSYGSNVHDVARWEQLSLTPVLETEEENSSEKPQNVSPVSEEVKVLCAYSIHVRCLLQVDVLLLTTYLRAASTVVPSCIFPFDCWTADGNQS